MVQSQMNCLISSDSSAASVTDTCALSLRCGNSIDFLSNTLPGITAGDWIKQRSPGYRASRVDRDRKSTRLNSSHGYISYAVFCLKKKKKSLNSLPNKGGMLVSDAAT